MFPFCRLFPTQFARRRARPGVWAYFEHRQEKQLVTCWCASSQLICRNPPICTPGRLLWLHRRSQRSHRRRAPSELLGCNQWVASVLSVFVWSVRTADGLVAGSHTDQPPESQSLDKTCRIPGFFSKSLDGTKTSEKGLFPPKKVQLCRSAYGTVRPCIAVRSVGACIAPVSADLVPVVVRSWKCRAQFEVRVRTVHIFGKNRDIRGESMEFSGKSCIRRNCDFSGSLLEIPGTPGVVLISRDFPGKTGRVGQYGIIGSMRPLFVIGDVGLVIFFEIHRMYMYRWSYNNNRLADKPIVMVSAKPLRKKRNRFSTKEKSGRVWEREERRVWP